jgi:hypothetical protein
MEMLIITTSELGDCNISVFDDLHLRRAALGAEKAHVTCLLHAAAVAATGDRGVL